MLQRFLSREKHAEHVGVEMPMKMLLADIFQRHPFINASVVDQDVDLPKGFLRFGEEPFDVCLLRHMASNRNHLRRSVSSIHTSMKLAVATSRCSSHTLCASRRRAANVLLSSINSASISNGSTYWALLSSTRCVRAISPIECNVI